MTTASHMGATRAAADAQRHASPDVIARAPGARAKEDATARAFIHDDGSKLLADDLRPADAARKELSRPRFGRGG